MAKDANDQSGSSREISAKKQDLERLRREIEEARDLLEFAVTEGGIAAISDPIIDEIKKAEEFLERDEFPSTPERAAFAKAYRDLSQALAPVTTSLLRPPSWQHPKYFWVFLFGLFFLLWCSGYLLIPQLFNLSDSRSNFAVVGATFLAFVGAGLFAFILRFGFFFLGAVTRRKLDQMISFCYFFTICAVLSPLLLVCGFVLTPNIYDVTVQGPIAFVLGCSAMLPQEKNPPYPILQPEAIRCSCANGKLLAPGVQQIPQGSPPTLPNTCNEDNIQWLVNVGGGITSLKDEGRFLVPAYAISGGLPVPLYIVVLSLMGGAVSMTRRVPEYQRRALDLTDRDMSPDKARENLVFQIMQVVSAPLIAITIYHVIGPSTRTISVVLGFASGFASETILLAIRALVDKLQPTPSASTMSENQKAPSKEPDVKLSES